MLAEGRANDMSGLMHGSIGQMQVHFVSPLNPYQTVNRALKYAVLFIGLVFLAYFLMETLLGVRVHPAQYLLIGVAQAVFYLLLLAFAEHIGFTLAFVLSAVATVVLTAGYAGAVFGRDLIWKSAGVFGAVYALLFVLMRIQDFALMVGALISFVAIAATLYLTRDMDWYGDKMSG
jgi:inner membrane protein